MFAACGLKVTGGAASGCCAGDGGAFAEDAEDLDHALAQFLSRRSSSPTSAFHVESGCGRATENTADRSSVSRTTGVSKWGNRP